MKDEREKKEKLLICAKQEFLEKGYNKASLRDICKKAGVTTGALYFFFKDKEDLFATLVQEPLDKLYAIMLKHYQGEMEQIQKGILGKDDHSEDIDAANQVVHYIYRYYEEFQLILTKSQGSRFENSIDRFVSITEQQYRLMANKFAQELNIQQLDDYIIHWTSHMLIDVFVHMLTHKISEKEALKHMNLIIKYLINGWYGMFCLPDKKW
ncbi:TetR/AcrR family transcriptional regulator [Clostridium oryzae]|uniref:TetR/AcrR family transcriptional regulator n=1 Tax=Clostridium oryzae TaxID=1450648 RepID=UPI00147388E4|nr:TetR/AcrR family transcriptional regulator [Clostridium oryzae]